MSTWMKIGHWMLNLVLLAASLLCVYIGVLGMHGTDGSSIFNRVMCVVASGGFGYLTYAFVKYTLSKG